MAFRSTKTPRGGARTLGRIVLDDLRRGQQLQRDYLRDLKELYLFYLDAESRSRVSGMGRVRGALWLTGQMFKSLYLKLSPPRRVGLLVAIVLMFLQTPSIRIGSNAYSADVRIWAFLILLIVLMLELKDKLLAKDEIQIARQVQIALLPREHPEIPGWEVWSYSRPANDVGGDLVDYVDLDGFRHGVVLGDVAGKGLGAALLSSKLQATLRALVPDAASLADLADRLNNILYRDGLDNRFATLFYAEMEHHAGQIRYLNAGHNPAFVIRADRIEELGPSSYPLGMLPTADYRECALEAAPGDMLLAYSDGLNETENEGGEQFGMERLRALLPQLRDLKPSAVGQRILDEVEQFIGDARPHDDLSLVVVVRK